MVQMAADEDSDTETFTPHQWRSTAAIKWRRRACWTMLRPSRLGAGTLHGGMEVGCCAAASTGKNACKVRASILIKACCAGRCAAANGIMGNSGVAHSTLSIA